MRTQEFVRWLKARDVNINPEALIFLANEGVFPPIAWEAPPASIATDRLVPVEIGGLGLVHGDRGQTPDLERLLDHVPTDIERESCWWHPFQLWRAVRLMRSLTVSIAPSQALYGPSRYRQAVDWWFRHSDPREALVRMTTHDHWSESVAILGILLAAEPLVIESINHEIKLEVGGASFADLIAWRQRIDHERLMKDTDTTISKIREWHSQLSEDAELGDPLSSWRELIAYVPRKKRLSLAGGALRAEEEYYQAQILRRYLQYYHDVTDLPDEDLVRLGPQVPSYKERFFGGRTTTDGNRSVFRNVVREYDLDPQPRLRWFVEGATEIGFIERWAELRRVSLERSGIELVDLGGVGKLEDPLVRAFLSLSQQEEIFVAMTVDGDEQDAERRRVLENMSDSGLLPADYLISSPDFEGHNFSLDILLEAANIMHPDIEPIDSSDIEALVDQGKAHYAVVREAHWRYRSVQLEKGAKWGRALADALSGRPEADEAPIHEQFIYLVRGSASNYRFSTTAVE